MANYNQTLVQQLASAGQVAGTMYSNTHKIARVTHVIQGPYYAGTKDKDPDYNDPTDLGKIKFQWLVGNQTRTADSNGNNLAKPINSALKHILVEGEFVQIVAGPGVELNDSRNQLDLYYTLPFDLWAASHHNAFPDLGDYSEYINRYNDTPIAASSLNRPVNTSFSGSTVYPLGPDFYEKSDIKSLRVFTGDVTLEGRWGNSIRFGSTTIGTANENYWSQTGSVGSPITIIRNGQGKQVDNVAWVPTIENVNRDLSLIYLTSNQKIVIDDIQNNFSLTSWQTNLESIQTNTITVQQQLTSFDAISPAAQDNLTNSTVNPNPPTGSQTPATPTGSVTTEPTPPPPPPTPPPAPTPTDTRGTSRGDYTNHYNNAFELFSKKSGFNTTVYAYQKGTQTLIKTGTPSSTADIDTLIRDMQLSLVDNNYYF